jgi:enoyl-CoA hydratase/carnithine racemase
MTEEALVLHSRDERGVVTLTLNRPQAFNSLSEAMIEALQSALHRVGEDRSARVVVIAGSGKAFCAGHDLKEMRAEPSMGYYERLFEHCGRMMLAIQHLPLPVVARVHGIATAAGCQLVAMCDLAVAAREARFAVSGVNLGLFCSTPSVALSRNLPRKQAFEMLVTGDFISADEALARALGKQLFYRQLEVGIASAYHDASRTMACNMMDESALEGVQAFIEKRPPNW